jgi:hypothetical protein
LNREGVVEMAMSGDDCYWFEVMSLQNLI